jgi:hypothetical protein
MICASATRGDPATPVPVISSSATRSRCQEYRTEASRKSASLLNRTAWPSLHASFYLERKAQSNAEEITPRRVAAIEFLTEAGI